MEISQIELIEQYADILQVGARNMQNYSLLRELGHARKPVLLKRGISATIEEWLLSAEYILAGGNTNVMLCERGIRTFESYTRNTLDISAIPVVQKLSHLPVVVDPSHGTGRRDKVAPMARAAVAAGADGLIIEVHCDPDHARVRRRAVDVPGAVRAADGRAAHHRAGDRPQHLRRAGRAARAGAASASWPRRRRPIRRFARVGIVGLGLIGGSIALALRRALAARRDRRRRSTGDSRHGRARAASIDERATHVGDLADVDSSCSPRPSRPSSRLLAERRRAPDCAAVVTDVGSTKRACRGRGRAARRDSLRRRPSDGRRASAAASTHARADLFDGGHGS